MASDDSQGDFMTKRDLDQLQPCCLEVASWSLQGTTLLYNSMTLLRIGILTSSR